MTATAVAVVGYLELHGDFQRWRDESALDSACNGLLDRNVVRDVLGPGSVEVENDENEERADRGLVGCEVHVDGGGTAEVRILDTSYAGQSLDSLYTGPPGAELSVPVGHGWAGLFGAKPKYSSDLSDSFSADEDVTVSLVLECAEASSVKGLSVTVETTLDKTIDNPANRPEFARIATSTAAKVSKTRHCGAELGRPVRSLGLPVNEDEYEPLGTAGGTCSGIPTAPGVSIATETDRGGAPYEICRLADADLSTRYVLEAEFGPYAEEAFVDYQEHDYGAEDLPSPDIPAHHRDGGGRVSWTTAKCSDGRALFTLQVAAGQDGGRKNTVSDPGLAYERAALRAFAERSAKAHGCSAPVTP
ncbi:hypothetical protein [Streptomyces himalayensis]|uniref:Uncharacterized protein n=1 Tax=Streptomyces himalayensis subsp. himalayensis TaxID=2756131 RepID=A0A7W0DGZ0_9ACTN|nr:hypothetical protein [Streptomyces himalayensis]MBA2944911.1 hypothetical protein [Streptomyces himalayensis subsp. himalayensis]